MQCQRVPTGANASRDCFEVPTKPDGKRQSPQQQNLRKPQNAVTKPVGDTAGHLLVPLDHSFAQQRGCMSAHHAGEQETSCIWFQGHAKQTERVMPEEHRWGQRMTNTKYGGVQVQTEWGQGLCPTVHLTRASTFWGLAHSLCARFRPQDSEEMAVSPSP